MLSQAQFPRWFADSSFFADHSPQPEPSDEDEKFPSRPRSYDFLSPSASRLGILGDRCPLIWLKLFPARVVDRFWPGPIVCTILVFGPAPFLLKCLFFPRPSVFWIQDSRPSFILGIPPPFLRVVFLASVF